MVFLFVFIFFFGRKRNVLCWTYLCGAAQMCPKVSFLCQFLVGRIATKNDIWASIAFLILSRRNPRQWMIHWFKQGNCLKKRTWNPKLFENRIRYQFWLSPITVQTRSAWAKMYAHAKREDINFDWSRFHKWAPLMNLCDWHLRIVRCMALENPDYAI